MNNYVDKMKGFVINNVRNAAFQFGKRCFLSSVKIARCKLEKHALGRVHKETLVLFWNTQKLVTRVVKERL